MIVITTAKLFITWAKSRGERWWSLSSVVLSNSALVPNFFYSAKGKLQSVTAFHRRQVGICLFLFKHASWGLLLPFPNFPVSHRSLLGSVTISSESYISRKWYT